jgi:hypothetical protein
VSSDTDDLAGGRLPLSPVRIDAELDGKHHYVTEAVDHMAVVCLNNNANAFGALEKLALVCGSRRTGESRQCPR